eukprot:CAMPEP_0115003446 /NCGR_PEP_ID=MMETSP0216-20121206/18617_1 /TAXON_ID=223996 /ORGANISM="Protocruzia adherens, Strain Boccale" /LENGTH=47 /DNA_ID= /DNA_START= /DNA_END= /DNA_ORIENTATION=
MVTAMFECAFEEGGDDFYAGDLMAVQQAAEFVDGGVDDLGFLLGTDF